MKIDFNRNRIAVISQDPKTIFSYGLQVKELITGIPNYQFHVISNQYLFGRPFELDGYVTWAHEGEQQMCTSTLKKVIRYTNPVCVFSMGDVQHYTDIPVGKPIQVPWISWFPWDNHDINGLMRARNYIIQPDVKITMSKFAFNLLKNYKIDVDDYIYNIVDTNVFRPLGKKEYDREALNKTNPKIADKKILLFVGRPSWRKNLEFLLAGFKEICRKRDDVLLYLHVDFNDRGVPDKPNIEKLIHGMNLTSKIMYTEDNQWTTGITSNFLNRLYNLCDLYISPHGGEGFGLPFCEAMATGTPFVATDCTTMPEFAEDGKRGLLASVSSEHAEKGIFRPWVNMDSFVDKILYLLEDEDLRKKMGRNGKDWVLKNCSKKVIVPKWKNIFDRLSIPICDVNTGVTHLEWTDGVKT